GGIVDRDYFDKDIAKPYYLLFSLNLIGFLVGAGRLVFGDPHPDTVLLNIAWTTYNLMITGGALAVASEKRQVREAVRVRTRLEAAVRLSPDSDAYLTDTLDVSYSGIAVQLPAGLSLAAGQQIQVLLAPQRNDVWLDVEIKRVGHGVIAVHILPMSIPQETSLVQALFGRADAWMQWRERQSHDRPLRALAAVAHHGVRGGRDFFRWMFKYAFNRDGARAPRGVA
ncbi:MAG: PilZ domain-containing protein, partial [Solimonas sp.]